MADQSAPLIAIKKLSKRYPGTKVPSLDELTLEVHAGEVYGFLGANGAGKSTTIRTLLGFLSATSGSAEICGLDIARQSVQVKQHVGYLSGDVALYPKVTGNELFAYLSKLQQTDTSSYLQELIHRFEAEPDKHISDLSKGNRQKIGVIQALMHQPDVLILDEPTSGLDPLMQEVFYETISEARDRGAAVFVSSHNLNEAQRMCDRIGIIKHGKLIREQSIKDDLSLTAPLFRVVVRDTKQADKLRHNPALKVLSHKANVLSLQPAGDISQALRALSECDIASFSTEQLNLEDEFLEYYGDGA